MGGFRVLLRLDKVWLLATAWVVLNLLDILVSWYGIKAGATEIGFLYSGLLGGFWATSIVKMGLTLLVMGGLLLLHKRRMLGWLSVGVLVVVIFNSAVLMYQT